MKVGDWVILTTDIYEEGEDLPPGLIAHRGDRVQIKEIRWDGYFRPYSVAHEGVSGSFSVEPNEIKSV